MLLLQSCNVTEAWFSQTWKTSSFNQIMYLHHQQHLTFFSKKILYIHNFPHTDQIITSFIPSWRPFYNYIPLLHPLAAIYAFNIAVFIDNIPVYQRALVLLTVSNIPFPLAALSLFCTVCTIIHLRFNYIIISATDLTVYICTVTFTHNLISSVAQFRNAHCHFYIKHKIQKKLEHCIIETWNTNL